MAHPTGAIAYTEVVGHPIALGQAQVRMQAKLRELGLDPDAV